METYGDLKNLINLIKSQKKDSKIKGVAIDTIVGNIPGIGYIKSAFDFYKAAIKTPDDKRPDSWLSRLDVDDEMSAIVDDNVENGFLKSATKTFEKQPDDKELNPDFDMNKEMIKYLDDKYSGRTLTGIPSFNLVKEDTFDKFLKVYSYKFDKGYPDMNDKQDILLMKSLLKEEFNILLENPELEEFFNKTNLFSDYGTLEITPKGIKFSEIPPRGSTADTLRNEVYALIKQLADNPKIKDLTDYKRGEKGKGSSLGRAEFKFKGKQYLLPIKGTGKEDSTSTDVKEGLVSMFYASNIDSPFNSENFDSRIEQLIEGFQKIIPGETKDVKDEVLTFLEGAQNTTRFIKFLNQPLSSALAIKKVYPGQKLIRTGDFDDIRIKATEITGYPADKWCPGDLYVEISSPGDIKSIEGIETLNDLFNDFWGENSKPLVAISLKQEAAQGGKAKAMLQQFTKVKNDYNLTKEEKNFTPDEYREGIKELRPKIQTLVAGNNNIIYNFTEGEIIDDRTRGKYAALKSIEFLFRMFPDQKVDDAVVALAGFALSLTGVNPTFYKLTGKSSGEPASVETFERGAAVELFSVDGDYEPIEIIDTPTFGGLKLKFMVEKAGEIHTVLLNARNNGTTQGTLEIQKIEQVSNQAS